MTLTPPPDTGGGLLGPGWALTDAASETGDEAFPRALLDAEAALTQAQAALGLAPAEAAAAVTAKAVPANFDLRDPAHRTGFAGPLTDLALERS